MKRYQLLCSALLAGAVAVAGCSREEARDNTSDAAREVRRSARNAGEQLSDSWLTTKIQAQYFADDDVKARHINVSTRDGIVTLTGYVEGEPQRKEAVQIAQNTDGVVRVEDGLTLVPRGGGESGAAATTGTAAGSAPDEANAVDDAEMTARVQAKYFTDDLVKGRHINVDSNEGVVTLSGEVAGEQERAQALRLARETEGVQRVEDNLTIEAAARERASAGQQLDDAAVSTTIQAKYFIDATVKDSDIDVTAQDGIVTLEGTVPDEAARSQAVAIARNTEGVTEVIDRLTVAARQK